MIKLNKKQRTILKSIFENPIRSNVLWADIEKLLIALGAELSEGRGSRIRIYLNVEKIETDGENLEKIKSLVEKNSSKEISAMMKIVATFKITEVRPLMDMGQNWEEVI